MNQILYYGGIGGCVFFLIISFALFFALKIPKVIKYLAKLDKIGIGKKDTRIKQKGTTKIKKRKNTNEANNPTAVINNQGDGTEVLSIAQNYATVLLDSENATTILDE